MVRGLSLTEDGSTAKNKNSKGKKAIGGTSKQVYLSSALSAWGDRLWTFAVGLYLAILFEGSFQVNSVPVHSKGISLQFCSKNGGHHCSTQQYTVSRHASLSLLEVPILAHGWIKPQG